MIIYIEEINSQDSYAVSRFVDHLIDIRTKNSLSKELTAQMKILNSIHINLHNAGMANRILKLQCFEYNIKIQCFEYI